MSKTDWDAERRSTEDLLGFRVSSYEKAMAAAEEQRYKEAYEIIMEALMPRTPDELYNWGVAYYNGHGVEKDISSALEWFEEADKVGSGSASRALGLCYLYGNGVEKNLELAAKYMTRGAEADNAEAQYNLGMMYSHGEGVEKNPTEALKWFEKSAKHFYERGRIAAANMYFRGKDIPRSFKKAWSLLYRYTYSNSDIGEGHYYDAQCLLGMMYLHGYGTSQDYEKAEACLKLAADHGDSEAQFWLGMMYYSGKGVPQDYNAALSWFQKSKENGFEQAVELMKSSDKRNFIKSEWEKAEQEAEEAREAENDKNAGEDEE